MATIMDLPTEILEIIFNMCSNTDLIRSVQLVCQWWRDIVFSSHVWQHRSLDLEIDRADITYLGPSLKFLPVKHLHIPCNLHEDTIFLSHVIQHTCDKIERLCLVYYCLPNEPEGSLQVFTGSLHCLSFSKLTHLVLHFDVFIDDSYFLTVNVSDVFPVLLQTLIIGGFFTTGKSVPVLLKTCCYLRHLEFTTDYMDLTDVIIHDDGADKPCFREPGEHNLRTFSITGFGNFLAVDVLNDIGRFQHLTTIEIRNFQFDDDVLFETLLKEPRPNLEHLDVSNSSWHHPNVCNAIARLFPNLRSLIISRCPVDDTGFRDIIYNLRKLAYLELERTKITPRYLIEIPQRLPDLKFLDVAYCNLSPDDIPHNLSQMKNLTLYSHFNYTLGYMRWDLRPAGIIRKYTKNL